MSTTSKYIQLSSSILLEYIYTDQSNPNRINTEGPNSNSIFKYSGFNNSDVKNRIVIHGSRGYRQDNCYIEDSENRVKRLKRLRNLLDISTKLDLPGESPVYDTVKLHFIQGFNYEGYSGFNLKLFLKSAYNKDINILHFITTKGDSYTNPNPKSFFFGGKHYTNYIELNILASYNLILDYFFGDKTVVNEITRGENGVIEGFIQDQTIQCKFSWLDNKEIINNIEYYYERESKIFDISVKDEYSELSAYIKESDEFDYFEYGAAIFGQPSRFKDYINSLNNNGYDYILLHTLNIFEFIHVPGIEPYWVLTDSIETSQIDNYDRLNLFRPIIKNDNAISFKIEYTLRFYNRFDNSYIWKFSSCGSDNVSKYSKILMSIQLDENPVQNILYNKTVKKEVKLQNILDYNSNLFATNSYTNPIINNHNILVNTQFLNGLDLNSILGERTYSDYSYDAKIILFKSTNYIKFQFAQETSKNSGTVTNFLDLSTLGKFYIRFFNDNGNILEIEEFNIDKINKSGGEVLFRITETAANKILSYKNREFSIVYRSNNTDSDLTSGKSTLATGVFYTQGEWSKLEEKNKKQLKEEIVNLNKIKMNLEIRLTEALKRIKNLSSNISNIQRSISPILSRNTKIANISTRQSSRTTSSGSNIPDITNPVLDNPVLDEDIKKEMDLLNKKLTEAQAEVNKTLAEIQNTLNKNT